MTHQATRMETSFAFQTDGAGDGGVRLESRNTNKEGPGVAARRLETSVRVTSLTAVGAGRGEEGLRLSSKGHLDGGGQGGV